MIRTDRLVLRPLRADDLPGLHAIMSDARAMRYWSWPAHSDLAQTKRFLDGCLRGGPDVLEYAVDLDGAFIGRVGMWQKAEIGYILRPDHWGRGLATEAVAALVRTVFHRFPGIDVLRADIDPRNLASDRLLRRLGFVLERVEEKNFLYDDAEWCDTAYFTLSRERVAQHPS